MITEILGESSTHELRFPIGKLKRKKNVFNMNGIKKHKTLIIIRSQKKSRKKYESDNTKKDLH